MLSNNYMSQHTKVRETVIKINDLYKGDLKENVKGVIDSCPVGAIVEE